jgi:uncharacterized membrane protein YjfL (UPF0719 family)
MIDAIHDFFDSIDLVGSIIWVVWRVFLCLLVIFIVRFIMRKMDKDIESDIKKDSKELVFMAALYGIFKLFSGSKKNNGGKE